MPYKGHVDGKVIVFDEPVQLPDGTHVLVTLEGGELSDPSGIAGSWDDCRTAEQIIADINAAKRSKS